MDENNFRVFRAIVYRHGRDAVDEKRIAKRFDGFPGHKRPALEQLGQCRLEKPRSHGKRRRKRDQFNVTSGTFQCDQLCKVFLASDLGLNIATQSYIKISLPGESFTLFLETGQYGDMKYMWRRHFYQISKKKGNYWKKSISKEFITRFIKSRCTASCTSPCCFHIACDTA